MTNAWRAAGLALGMTLGGSAASGLSGCELDARGRAEPDGGGGEGGTTVDGGGGSGGDGGMGGEGGSGGLLVTGSQYVPGPLRPSDAATLPPTRGFLLWQEGELPSGLGLAGYELCRTSGPASEIDADSECPNPAMIQRLYEVVDPLIPLATHRWKVRARFDNGGYSEWSPVRSFAVDASVVGRWLFDGNAMDASVAGHDGALQGGAAFASGLIGQALDLDGVNDHVTVADTPDHDFGPGDFWLAAWIYPLRDGMAEALVTKRGSTNGYELYRSAAGELVFFSSGCGNAATGGSLPIGAWRHVVARRTGATVRLYVDSVPVGTGTCAENFNNSGPLTLGNNGPDVGNSEPFEGRIDEAFLRDTGGDEAVVLNEYCAAQAVAGSDPLPAACLP